MRLRCSPFISSVNKQSEFEDELIAYYGTQHYLNQWVSYDAAVGFIRRVWELHCPAPTLMTWNNENNGHGGWDGWAGYYENVGHYICIRDTHRSRRVILHELVHAEGYGGHDLAFARRFANLLDAYAHAKWEVSATLFGLRGVHL